MDTTTKTGPFSFKVADNSSHNLSDALGMSDARMEAMCAAIFDEFTRDGSTQSSTLEAISNAAETPQELVFGAYAYGTMIGQSSALESLFDKAGFHKAVKDMAKASN